MKYKKYEKCLFELMTEKNNIMANKGYHTILIDKIDKIIESIHCFKINRKLNYFFMIYE
jgi:hypothetical protein